MNKYDEKLTNSLFFNKAFQPSILKMESLKPKELFPQLIKLNIASGPNVFPFDGWVNYDKEDFTSYFYHLDWQDKEKTIAYKLEEMPEHQQKLANYMRSGGKVQSKVKNISERFEEHEDNSVDMIYLGQMIEHLNPRHQLPVFLNECYRMLKPGGLIRITTPSLNLLVLAYVNNQMALFEKDQPDFYKNADPGAQLSYLMFGATGANCTQTNYEGHFFLFTEKSMISSLQLAGFKDIEFYTETGKSKSDIMKNECVDAGVSHSLLVEAIK
jgi:SAM-dependent methyltransferase